MAMHDAWSLVCRLFAGGTPVFREALSPAEVRACANLGQAIKSIVVNRTFNLCPYCQLQNGKIFSDGKGGQFCNCPECGRIELTPSDRDALELDESWLRARLRMAMDIESRDGVTVLAEGVWRLGDARREPVLLSRSLTRIWAQPAMLDRVRVPGAGVRVIAPRSLEIRGAPFPAGIDWLALEERFTFYGGRISYIPGPTPLTVQEPNAADPSAPVNGPFSADFKWVKIPNWQHGPIRCTGGQAKVFDALWEFKGVPVSAERVMTKAGLSSKTPSDLFKIKKKNQGDPDYEGPHLAYRTLVQVNRCEGTYRMPCALGSSGWS